MTSKTKRWLMSLPLVMLPFTVTPMEAGAGEEVGGPCFGFVFTEGGGVVDHGAFTGVWFNDSSGHTGVHHGESFFLLTSGAFFSPTDTLIVHAELPEPATLATFGFGLAGLGLLARRRRKD